MSRVCTLGPLFAVCFAAVGGSGCRSQAERDISAEVAQVALLVDRVREAPNNEKAAPLAALQQLSCRKPQACELQQVCAQGYSLHERAIETANTVRHAMRSGSGTNAVAAELLLNSEQDLARAKALIDRCVELQGTLSREYLL